MRDFTEELEGLASPPQLLYVSGEQLRRTNINLAAGQAPLPGESVPEHRTWEWLPDSARRSGTGLVFMYRQIEGELIPWMAAAPPFPVRPHHGLTTSFKLLMDTVWTNSRVIIVDLHIGDSWVGVANLGWCNGAKRVGGYVRGQHRAGGQSAKRFKRNRDNRVREYYDKLAAYVNGFEAGRRRRGRESTDWLAVAGDQHAAQRWLKQTDVLQRDGIELLPRTFDSPKGSRKGFRNTHETFDRLAREIWSTRIYEPPQSDLP